MTGSHHAWKGRVRRRDRDPGIRGQPWLTVERTIDVGDVVVVTGTGIGHHRENGRFRFVYGDRFTFRDGLIAQVDSYVVPLS